MGEVVTWNVIDRTFAAIHSRAVPWTVHAEWFVGGPVDRGRLKEAVAATVHRHPLLQARQGAGEEWVVPESDEVPPVAVGFWDAVDDRAVAALRDRLVSRKFDLRRELPVRFAVVQAPDGDHVVLVADHALMDGVGIGRTAVSLMAEYVARSSSAARLPSRAGTAAMAVSGPRVAGDAAWREAHALTVAAPPAGRVQQVVDRLRRRATPPAVRLAPECVQGAPRSGYGVAYHDLSAPASEALASLAGGLSTASDVLVAAVCLAGMRWNRVWGRPELPFSVGVPVNLRPARTWFEGVCNATLPWPVRLDDAHPEAVVSQVTAQLRPVRAGIYSTEVRAVLGHLSGRTSLSIRERQALATTTVVSIVPGADVGRAHLPAGVATSRLYGGAPAPPMMGMTFAVIPDRTAHRLSARYLRSRHSAAGAAFLLGAVDAAVVELCELRQAKTAAGMEGKTAAGMEGWR